MAAIKPSHEKIKYVFEAGFNVNYSENSKDIKYDVHMEYVRGNHKYDSSVLIISSSSSHNCICKNICPLYKNGCYAFRDEESHGQKVVDFKDRQGYEFMHTDNELIIQDLLNIQKNVNKKLEFLRLNEAGDLSKAFLIKAYDLHLKMQQHETLKEIIIFTYTHNYKLYDQIKSLLNKKFVVNNSVQDKNHHNTLSNNYIVLEEYAYNHITGLYWNEFKTYNLVICNCNIKCGADCKYCMTNNKLNILVKMH